MERGDVITRDEKKKYVNANKVLPADLIKEIQKHIEGAYLYIPKTERTAWGSGTGLRKELDRRNNEIINSYQSRIEIHILAEGYFLSEERVRAIVFGYGNSSLDEKEEDAMIDPKGFDKERARITFCKCVDDNSLSLEYVDVMYLKVRKDDSNETLTFYYNTSYKDTELREAARLVTKALAKALHEPICLRQTSQTSV